MGSDIAGCSDAKGRCLTDVLLTSANANLSVTDKDGNTALHLACSNVSGKEDCVLLIMEKLADSSLINATNTALQTREVADCLALILATMMPFCSPCSSGAPSPGSLLRQLPHQGCKSVGAGPRGPRSPRNPSGPSSEGTTENDSEDSETF
ncbi:hypothetical protein GOODEAATRI_002363 [Goodea atripinnis]|uniref:Uncharacterized protein n=1 Tax=Goodea atripinnis TaxID=208336 RepID=A0ABV0PUL2_9TELE